MNGVSNDLSSSEIRKLIIGTDPFKAYAFVVGNRISSGSDSVVHSIEFDDRFLHKFSKTRYDIYLKKKDGEVFFWKSVIDMPSIAEVNCNF